MSRQIDEDFVLIVNKVHSLKRLKLDLEKELLDQPEGGREDSVVHGLRNEIFRTTSEIFQIIIEGQPIARRKTDRCPYCKRPMPRKTNKGGI